MQSALEGDRRLVVAGFHPGETVLARLLVLICATAVVVGVSALVTALNFTAASWLPLISALILLGLIYAAIGALAGALLDKLAATYLMLLPGYGPSRMMYDGAFSQTFHASGELALGLAWLAVLAAAVVLVLRRAVGTREGAA